MRNRRRLIRLAKFLGVLFGLFVVLVVLFWIFCFNPFEGDLEHLDGLVPNKFAGRGVSYVIRAPSLETLSDSAFFAERVRTSPGWRNLEKGLNLDQLLFDQIRDTEQQVRVALGGLVEFNVMDDVFGREVLVAGDIDFDDPRASPYLFLTRISWKMKFLDLLGYDSVRERVNQPGRFTIRAKRDWFEIVIEDPAWKNDPEEELIYYLARVRDVLAFSNDLDLIKDAVFLRDMSVESLRVRHPGYQGSLPFGSEGRVASAWFDVDVLDKNEKLSELLRPDATEPREIEDLFLELLPPHTQYDASFELDLDDGDRLTTSIRFAKPKRTPKHLMSFYRGDWFENGDIISELGRFAPEKRTIALGALSIDPVAFLTMIYTYQHPDLQKLVGDELVKAGLTHEGLAEDLGRYMKGPVGLILTRINEKVDGLDFDNESKGDAVNPRPAVHLTMRFRNMSHISHFLEYLADQAEHLPVGLERVAEPLDGLPDVQYFNLPFKFAEEDDPLLAPAIAIQGDRFFFSTNGEELLLVLRRAAAGEKGTLAASAAVRRLAEQPPTDSGLLLVCSGGPLRSYLNDLRHTKAMAAADEIVTNQTKLARIRAEASRAETVDGGEFTRQVSEAIERRVSEWVDTTRTEEFEKGLEAWKAYVANFDAVGTVVLTLRPGTEGSDGQLFVECTRPGAE
jgi:hypothetical protein